MAVAAEAVETMYAEADQLPLVIVVPELPEDELLRARAARIIQAAGHLAVEGDLDYDPWIEARFPSGYRTLMDAIHAAANGDPMARRVITVNASTDMAERAFKAGHVVETRLGVNARGEVVQYGQRLRDVHANALRYATRTPAMRARTEAETRNGVRIDHLRRQHLLEDYALVTFSCYPDNMTDEDAAAAGFFADTKSCAIQVLTAHHDHLVQQSAFVAGVREIGGERHDIAAVQAIAERLGVSLAGKTVTEILEIQLLIHKSLVPDGAVTVAEWYDDEIAAGTFFGQAKPPQNYLGYLEICREREAGFGPAVQAIVDQLIAEAASIHTPVDAVRRLHELSQARLVDQALGDVSINPRVFGAVAAQYIEQGRAQLAQGDVEAFLATRSRAQQTAQSFSCPAEFDRHKENETEAKDATDDECEFVSKECPICHVKNVKTKVTKTQIIGITCGCIVKKS